MSGTLGGSRAGREEVEPLSVLVVDDHDLVHWGLRALFTAQPWVHRYVAAYDAREGVELATAERPGVALVDSVLGMESGADLPSVLRAASPGTRVVLMAAGGGLSPRAARELGADGLVDKSWPAQDIVAGTRTVALGMSLFGEDPDPVANDLSERERDVLRLIAAGATNREIASRLDLSTNTVKSHTSAVYRKLGARNRAEAIAEARRLGILS
jgi:DNA-binding NarL/FixJ family response regulator